MGDLDDLVESAARAIYETNPLPVLPRRWADLDEEHRAFIRREACAALAAVLGLQEAAIRARARETSRAVQARPRGPLWRSGQARAIELGRLADLAHAQAKECSRRARI